jgi:succinate dehydrogenase/fumarate reductase flavoprotein subunit
MSEKRSKTGLAGANNTASATKWDMETDVVVVGFGGAGGAAAIEAHDAGAEVIVLEKGPSNQPGGNTGCCAGYMLVPSSLSGGVDYYRALSFGTVADEELIHTLAKEIMDIPDWLRRLGGPLFVERRQAPGAFPTLPGAIVDVIGVEEGGFTAFKKISSHVESRGIKIMYETAADRLIQDPSSMEILGVVARGENADLWVKARKGVVLACGGYENNPEMIMNFNYPGVRFYPAGTPYNTGDGITMSTAAGAKLWHMASLEFMSFAIKAPSDLFNCSVSLPYNPMSGNYIFVNKYGRRFIQESRRLGHYKGDIEACNFDHYKAEYPNIPLFMIFDETVRKNSPLVPEKNLGNQTMTWLTVHKIYEWSGDNSREIEKGWIIKGDTIEELAQKMGLDPKETIESVNKFNKYCKEGFDPEFNRVPQTLLPIESPPFYGTELCLNLVNTQGGPVHNARSQVIGVNDKPIPRLYAAGELGSFFGHLYQGGSNFPEAFAFGKIAGKNAASEIPWDQE